jgi:hypothetical protein
MNLLRRYFWWTYERGSLHYDVMVTLILAFVFISPHVIDFKDKPSPPMMLSPSQVLVKNVMNGQNRHLVFEVRAADLAAAQDDTSRQDAIQRIVEPIAGDVTINQVTPVTDTHGAIVAYDASVTR